MALQARKSDPHGDDRRARGLERRSAQALGRHRAARRAASGGSPRPCRSATCATFLARLRADGRTAARWRWASICRSACRAPMRRGWRSGTSCISWPRIADAAGLLPGLRDARRGGPGSAVLSGARRARDDTGGTCRGAGARWCRRAVARLRPSNGGAAGRRAAVLDPGRQPVGQGGDRGVAGHAAARARQRRRHPPLAVRRRLSDAAGARARWRWRRPIPPRRCAISVSAEGQQAPPVGPRGGRRAACRRRWRRWQVAAGSRDCGSATADGFGADAAGEDRFDCVLGVLCVLNVLAGNRPGHRAG